MTVRTRFAPSPTGYMHVGNLRTALYAYLIAKQAKGVFMLRIEDTDQEREVEGALDIIYDTLRETGLLWDEGPDKPGAVGPYVQSERLPIYKEYAEMLVERGHAYYCFCGKRDALKSKEQAKAAGAEAGYDRHCRDLPADVVAENLKKGLPYVIRQRVPLSGETTFSDSVYGDITVPNDSLSDGILLKQDGYPTYNFANVVDDHLMGITHVVRGQEYLSSAPKYNLLYEAFGWDIPVYIHCPAVMKDKNHKLSKRNGDASYQDLVAKGYLTEAILNYIALLGWSPKGERELFTLPELVEAFDIAGVSKSPAIFDPVKLAYINGEYIKALPDDEFLTRAAPFMAHLQGRGLNLPLLAEQLRPRVEVLHEVEGLTHFLVAMPDYDVSLYENKKLKIDTAGAKDALVRMLPVLETLGDYSKDSVYGAVAALAQQLEVKNGALMWPLRVALCGQASSPGGGVELAAILGRDETVARVKAAIGKLNA